MHMHSQHQHVFTSGMRECAAESVMPMSSYHTRITVCTDFK